MFFFLANLDLCLCLLGNFSCFLSGKKIRNVVRVSNSLDSDEARRLVRIGLVPNCLQKLSADVTFFCFHYRKQELYSLEWGDLIDLSKFVVVAAPYGGPVGKEISLTLNAPIATKVVCFSRLLKCLRSLYGKQCGSRSDCSYRSSLYWINTVCFYT